MEKLHKKKFLLSGGVVFVASFIAAMSNWGQLVVLTKTFKLLEIGVYTLALAISNPIFNFLSFQLASLYVSDRSNKFNFQTYISLRVVTSSMLFLVGGLVSFFVFSETTDRLVFFGIFIFYSIDALRDIIDARLQHLEMFKLFSLSIIINSSTTFLGILIGVLIFSNFALVIFFAIIFKISALYFYTYKIIFKEKLKETFQIKLDNSLIKLIKYAFYLGVYLTLISLNVNIPKYFVNSLYGIEYQGAFSSMSYFIVVGTLMVSSLGRILLPKLSIYYYQKNVKKIKGYQFMFLGSVFVIGILLLIISSLFGTQILKFFFSKEISEFSDIFVWIMAASVFLFLSSAQGYLMTSVRVIKLQPLIAFIGLTVNLILNLIFYGKYGVKGIMIFSGISFFSQFLLNVIIFNNKISINKFQ